MFTGLKKSGFNSNNIGKPKIHLALNIAFMYVKKTYLNFATHVATKKPEKTLIQKPSWDTNHGLDLFQSLAFFLWFLEFFLFYKTERNVPVLQKISRKRF